MRLDQLLAEREKLYGSKERADKKDPTTIAINKLYHFMDSWRREAEEKQAGKSEVEKIKEPLEAKITELGKAAEEKKAEEKAAEAKKEDARQEDAGSVIASAPPLTPELQAREQLEAKLKAELPQDDPRKALNVIIDKAEALENTINSIERDLNMVNSSKNRLIEIAAQPQQNTIEMNSIVGDQLLVLCRKQAEALGALKEEADVLAKLTKDIDVSKDSQTQEGFAKEKDELVVKVIGLRDKIDVVQKQYNDLREKELPVADQRIKEGLQESGQLQLGQDGNESHAPSPSPSG